MRGWSSNLDPVLKKPPLDKVEVVSDLVDLTAASDNEGDETDLKKKEKKAKKEQKRKEKERKREELRQAQAERAKAAREERLLREAQELSRRLADEAALRAAARREGGAAAVRGTPGPIEIDEEEPEAPAAPTPPEAPPAKRPRATEGRESLGFQHWEPPEPPPGVQAASMPQLPSPGAAPLSGPGPEAAEPAAGRPRAAQEAAAPAGDGRQKAAAAARKGLGPSMAEAIAAASREQAASGFASFEVFDAKGSHEKAHGQEAEEPDPDDDEDEDNPEGFLPMELYSLQDLPEDLILADMTSEPGLYIAHYIRYVLGAWQRMLVSGKAVDTSGLTNQTAALFKSKEKFQSTAEALKPLLRQLRSRKIHGEMLSGLETVVKLAAEREYNHANSVYMGMTMGRKTWHNSLPCFQQQQNHGGSVRKIIKQSELMDFDWDPVVQFYMHALKRVIQFAQCIRPPDDPAKCA